MSNISVPLSTNTFMRLVNFFKENESSRDPVSAVEAAVEYWLDNASWKKDDLMPEIAQQARGYSWKGVFLPHGTLVRIKYNGKFYYARVELDHLIYEGTSLSPNQFASKVTGTARDAWRDLWIKRPTDSDYILADDLRNS